MTGFGHEVEDGIGGGAGWGEGEEGHGCIVDVVGDCRGLGLALNFRQRKCGSDLHVFVVPTGVPLK